MYILRVSLNAMNCVECENVGVLPPPAHQWNCLAPLAGLYSLFKPHLRKTNLNLCFLLVASSSSSAVVGLTTVDEEVRRCRIKSKNLYKKGDAWWMDQTRTGP